MHDRVPTYPGRVKLIPVAGEANTYDMVRADEPLQDGTPINKATLLTDETATALGLPNTSTVNDALKRSALLLSGRTDFYSSDFYLYITGRHPVLNAGPYNDYFEIEAQDERRPKQAETELGTYVGNGAKSRSLTFKRAPKLLIITCPPDLLVFINPLTTYDMHTGTSTAGGTGTVTWGNRVSWSATNATLAGNVNTKTYAYFALTDGGNN